MGMTIDEVIEELKQHIFELSFALDSQSAGKDYVALRNTHYNNMRWIHDNGFSEEYYQYFFKAQFGGKGEENEMSIL